jgi:hypothetical protein
MASGKHALEASRKQDAVEIMAITGHKSLAEVERYVRAANQKRMSETAIEKVSRTQSYPRPVQSYPQEKKA